MRDPDIRQRRIAMLHSPHMGRLVGYVSELRNRDLGTVPDFDPLDGGIEARVLFLLEKPGPKAFKSGFISRNNNDATAANTHKFMQQAGIPRKFTVIWNVVPWWNGKIDVTSEELGKGAACVEELCRLLPALRAVVMVGGKAAKAKRFLETTGLKLFESCHPSNVVRATNRQCWESIPTKWAEVKPFIGIES